MIPSDNPIIQNVGNRIKDAREAKQLTQAGLAKLIDVSRTAVTQWESSMTFPNLEKILELAKILGVSPEYIAFNRDNPVEYRTPSATVEVPVVHFGEKVEDRQKVAIHYIAADYLKAKNISTESDTDVFFYKIESESFAAKYAPGSHLLIDGNLNRWNGDGDYLIWTGVAAQLANLSTNLADSKTVMVQMSTGGAGQAIETKALKVLGRVKGVLN